MCSDVAPHRDGEKPAKNHGLGHDELPGALRAALCHRGQTATAEYKDEEALNKAATSARTQEWCRDNLSAFWEKGV